MPVAFSRAKTSSNSCRDIANARCSPPWVRDGESSMTRLGVTRRIEKGPVLAVMTEAHHLRVEADASRAIVDGEYDVIEFDRHDQRTSAAHGDANRLALARKAKLSAAARRCSGGHLRILLRIALWARLNRCLPVSNLAIGDSSGRI